MKKLVSAILLIMSCNHLHALPIGNPIEASLYKDGVFCPNAYCNLNDPCFTWCDALSLRLGFYGDYVFNRHMEVDTSFNHRDIDMTTLYTNAGYIVGNICDRIDIFGTVGATKIEIQTDELAWNLALVIGDLATGINSLVNFQTAFSWSAGGRATLWECNGFGLGVEGQYFQTHPNFNYFRIRDEGGRLFYINESARYSEWQLGGGISYRYVSPCHCISLVPYIGVKWAESKFKLGNVRIELPFDDAILFDLKSKRHWGYAIGISLTWFEILGVTVEGRFIDERALNVRGQIRF